MVRLSLTRQSSAQHTAQACDELPYVWAVTGHETCEALHGLLHTQTAYSCFPSSLLCFPGPPQLSPLPLRFLQKLIVSVHNLCNQAKSTTSLTVHTAASAQLACTGA